MKKLSPRYISWLEIIAAAALAAMIYMILDDPGGVVTGFWDAME